MSRIVSRPSLLVLVALTVLTAQTAPPLSPESTLVRQNYQLSFDDEIAIRVADVSEISATPIRIDQAGFIRVPLIGRVSAAGLTAEQLAAEIEQKLKAYVLRPEVTVVVTSFRSQPVSVLGSVKNPGIFQLEGRRSLGEVISLAGGLDSTASGTVKLTRRSEQGRIPRHDVVADPAGQSTSFEANLTAPSATDAAPLSLALKPFDTITVPRARMVYVVGQVQRSGGFVLQDRSNIGVLQALALAGGMDATAAPEHSRVLRLEKEGKERSEVSVDLKKVLQGRSKDVLLEPEDILFVPSSAPKKAAIRALEAAIQMGTGVVIWHK